MLMEKNKNCMLFEKYFIDYIVKNIVDYFIYKNFGKFLN